jgi:hypothetical protein
MDKRKKEFYTEEEITLRQELLSKRDKLKSKINEIENNIIDLDNEIWSIDKEANLRKREYYKEKEKTFNKI